jgi:hypothetical protein
MIYQKHVAFDKMLSADMTLNEAGLFRCVWHPFVPRRVTEAQLDTFMSARNDLIAEARTALASDALQGYRKSIWE